MNFVFARGCNTPYGTVYYDAPDHICKTFFPNCSFGERSAAEFMDLTDKTMSDIVTKKVRAPGNRTLSLSGEELDFFRKQLFQPESPLEEKDMENRIINGDFFKVINLLPEQSVDLMIIDPPYNLHKDFNGRSFKSLSNDEYIAYLESWFPKLLPLLKPHATVYMCGDWRSSAAMFNVMDKYLYLRNRICWQREKGRAASANWKNCCEDIWFATVGKEYCFNADAVRMKRQVLAPYRQNGRPKDWEDEEQGKFRLTGASNFWDDISIPYWSMPENTDHPTQKSEKLLAKLILASSDPGDMVFDPFMGSGSTAVAAKKLNRRFSGIEIDQEYCCWALARLERAEQEKSIQGYEDGVFWERNTLARRKHN